MVGKYFEFTLFDKKKKYISIKRRFRLLPLSLNFKGFYLHNGLKNKLFKFYIGHVGYMAGDFFLTKKIGYQIHYVKKKKKKKR
jgi:hypothetical protein